MKSLPVRLRLTLWYFAMLAAAALLLCAASLQLLRICVDRSAYDELKERAEDVQLLLSHSDPSPDSVQFSNELKAIYELKDDGKYLQVRDERGNWLFRSKRMVAQNPDLPAPALLPQGGQIADFHQGTRYVRVLAYPIAARGMQYSVQTGLALNKSMVLVANFRNSLLLLAPVVILLAALGGHAMSRKALQPVAALAAQARLINDRSLDTRLPELDTNDEISDLSRTLNQMLERIDRAFVSIRAFTGNASHELRTPISLLRTEIDVALLRPRGAAEYQATLMQLNEHAIRMTRLVENLLSLARADGGAEVMCLNPIELCSLFQSLHRTWASTMQDAMLDFRIEAPREEILLLGDTIGIQRLLSILLENAAKFTPPGGSVTLSVECSGACGVLSVRDTGIGISEKDQRRIFDRFFRATQSSNATPGSGLGLALAKWIADRHGSQLTVESRLGQGSCFSISLPSVAVPESFENSILQKVAD